MATVAKYLYTYVLLTTKKRVTLYATPMPMQKKKMYNELSHTDICECVVLFIYI